MIINLLFYNFKNNNIRFFFNLNLNNNSKISIKFI